MAWLLAGLLLTSAAHSSAVVVQQPNVIDPTTYAKTSDVSAAIASGIAAATPNPCTAPSGDTLNGSAGSQATCMPRADATRPTVVQRANTTTDASGNFTVTWSRTFVSSTPVVTVKPVLSAGSKGDCGFSTVNATIAAGSCWTYQSVVVSVLGSTVNPLATAAAGIRVMLVGGEPSQ